MSRSKDIDSILELPDKRKERMLKSFNKKYVIDLETGCWNWIRATHGGGYGGFSYGGTVLAHRASYVLHKGSIGNLCVMHKCDNRKCVNPDHLILGTRTENNIDTVQKGRNNPLKGEEAGNSKLIEAQILEIRKLHADGWGYKRLSEKFDTSISNVHSIISRLTWHHI